MSTDAARAAHRAAYIKAYDERIAAYDERIAAYDALSAVDDASSAAYAAAAANYRAASARAAVLLRLADEATYAYLAALDERATAADALNILDAATTQEPKQ